MIMFVGAVECDDIKNFGSRAEEVIREAQDMGYRVDVQYQYSRGIHTAMVIGHGKPEAYEPLSAKDEVERILSEECDEPCASI